MSAPIGMAGGPKGKATGARTAASRRPQPVNLARRPFANTRHIRRLGITLWVVGALLLALDGFLYWRSLFGIESKQEERAAIETAIAKERERLASAERQLAAIDLEEQNEEAEYLNERIAQRTFPWSALFDQLADVLPKRVRLYSLAPQMGDADSRSTRGRTRPEPPTVRRAAAPAQAGDRVHLQLTGMAESDEALLELLDNLFEHPAFDAPQLPNEARAPDGVQFSVNVFYLPGVRPDQGDAFRPPGGAADAEVIEDDGTAGAGDGVPPGGQSGDAAPGEDGP